MAIRFAGVALASSVLLLAVLGDFGWAEEPGDAAGDRVKVVRATYALVPPAILRLKEPIRVTHCAEQKVPITFGLVFTDADGINHSFNWHLDKGSAQNREFDRLYWTRYKGMSPLGQDLLRLPVRGPEEVALYGVLLRWAADREKAKDLSLFDQAMLKEVNGLLKRLDERFAGETPVAQKW